ncbi:pseudouridine synthase [Nonlabens sp. YIK11]|uniref:tRNA pseudouridine(38-40) synthase TruA n=1 Tax=Nonlabens sp. YIK11 TaxID=1453349 RepID=UPI0006DD0AFF|nr:tRNA pseudouridine(38-40) synthase TruA [Nonlabens sp. YIK11]KQC34360.1 pseudouridine synthase [Nonlabens sp. YIK11]
MQKQRYFIELAYDGTAYHGWQRQPQSISVQEVLEDGLLKMLRAKTYVTGAGRTDTGVHATQMFAHFDWECELDPIQLTYRLNRWFPKDISVFEIKKVTDKAHARFSATHRSYEYRFHLRPDPFKNRSRYILYRIPDIALMQKAADVLLDYTDFECFSRTNTDVKTYLCDISEARFEQNGFELIFHITANRFLRNMVRAVVGTLLEVGYGKLEVEDMHRILKSKDRGKAGASAPAQGLYLTRVRYPQEIWIDE